VVDILDSTSMAREVEQQYSRMILEALLCYPQMRIHEDQALCTETIRAVVLLGLQKKTRDRLACPIIKMGRWERRILIIRWVECSCVQTAPWEEWHPNAMIRAEDLATNETFAMMIPGVHRNGDITFKLRPNRDQMMYIEMSLYFQIEGPIKMALREVPTWETFEEVLGKRTIFQTPEIVKGLVAHGPLGYNNLSQSLLSCSRSNNNFRCKGTLGIIRSHQWVLLLMQRAVRIITEILTKALLLCKTEALDSYHLQ
jgi:hypothetical protein